MGTSFSSTSSNRRRNNNNYYHQNPHAPSQLISSSPSYPPEPYNPPYPYPPPPPVYYGSYSYVQPGPQMAPNNYGPYYHNGFPGVRPPPMVMPVMAPPAYVDHQQAKKVQNDVNVHKETLKLEVDEENSDHHLVSFVFDALFDGCITIFYFAKEEQDCRFVPVFPEVYIPVKIPFQKGHCQKFRQPSGTGIDLGFFELTDLTKPSPEDVFPLIISAETSPPTDEEHRPKTSSPHIQITQAILEKNNGDPFKVRVIKQILYIDEVRYELREIYGIGNSTQGFNDGESEKECVICMTEPKNTAVLPCRHMCMCSECAKTLRLQSNKCPICRQPIDELMEIIVNNVDQ